MKKIFTPIIAAVTCMIPFTVHADPFIRADLQIMNKQEALNKLSKIPVKPVNQQAWRDYRGNRINLFGKPWTDQNNAVWGHNSCDTRDDILQHQLDNVKLSTDDCRVLDGDLTEPYSGRHERYIRGTSSHPSNLDGEHIIPLHYAYATGAATLTKQQRTDLANDPDEVIMADHKLNLNKSDKSIANWVPPNQGAHCGYAQRTIQVAYKYHLWFTPEDVASVNRLLNECPLI